MDPSEKRRFIIIKVGEGGQRDRDPSTKDFSDKDTMDFSDEDTIEIREKHNIQEIIHQYNLRENILLNTPMTED